MITTQQIEEAHKLCEKPQIKKGTEEYTDAQWKSIDLYGFRCVRCGKQQVYIDAHHIVRRREGKTWGGCDHTGNLVPMCRECHTHNPIRPQEIQELTELSQFTTLVRRIEKCQTKQTNL